MSSLDFKRKDYYNQIYDYYKLMLTHKQKQYFELYFQNDYTLEEIAEQFNVTKSAIHDSISKVTKILDSLEENIGQYKRVKNIKLILRSFEKGDISKFQMIKQIEEEL
ncbi:sigma factor-like helix-turn-helix DNA-binding protein [Spiroplasma endosymbiont of Aspidapion aeneum]|uniref:sigma factor-like helix-turn-helix DNA-binding protein n=1 Tax=Spiroplasma endosymbiont of Aspidapion aeneum TaxID=3066276 RepID=UPI00313AE418